jgi:hypothetical protein
MNILINIDAVGDSTNDIVDKSLHSEDIKPCFGNMIPPLLERMVEIDDEEILAITKSQPEENFDTTVDLKNLIVLSNSPYEDKSLTIAGRTKIEKFKYGRVSAYITQLKLCKSCEDVDVCDKLTRNYLTLISLEKKSMKEKENK